MKLANGLRIGALVIIFIATFALRMHFAYQSPDFVDEYSYFYQEQADHFKDTKNLLFTETGPTGERRIFFPPVFAYLISLLSYVFTIETVGKVILNLIATSSVILIYLICRHITHHDVASLTASATGGMVPSFIALTFGSLSPYSIAIPLFLLLVYLFLNLHSKIAVYAYIACIAIYAFLHPSVLIVALALILYVIIMLLEDMPIPREEQEIAFFSLFLVLWSQFLLYKKVFLSHGIGVIWQNIPIQLIQNYFSSVTVMDALVAVGTFPLAFGMFTIIKYLHNIKNASINLIIASGLSCGILTYYRLLSPQIGFAFIGITFVILFAQALKLLMVYIPQTKFSQYHIVINTSIIIIILLFSIVPAIAYAQSTIRKSVVTQDLNALIWIRYNLPEGTIIAATPEEGHLIKTIGKKETVLDSNFLLVSDSKKRYSELADMFTSPVATHTIELMEKTGAKYVLVTPSSRALFKIDEPPSMDSDCFARTQLQNINLYERICNIKTS